MNTEPPEPFYVGKHKVKLTNGILIAYERPDFTKNWKKTVTSIKKYLKDEGYV